MDDIFNDMGTNNWLPYSYECDHLVSELECGADDDELFYCVPYHGKNDDQLDILLDILKQEHARIIELRKDKKIVCRREDYSYSGS